MKTKSLVLVIAIALVGMIFLASGCKKEEPQSLTDVVKTAVEENLCTKCGHIKGTELCCKAGAEKCDKCGMHKGSPGCCK